VYPSALSVRFVTSAFMETLCPSRIDVDGLMLRLSTRNCISGASVWPEMDHVENPGIARVYLILSSSSRTRLTREGLHVCEFSSNRLNCNDHS